ncbi:uncharacterized protein LOC108151787 isoform X1 [Drosophila miranda]|uniref:uncharacterized protein LOC108151787 isoform X1 n=1 Tax=Drosophila miranda TaxID=7229 RepID=UPI0007E6EC62|nr:uncharacterized protein LOC108151787 isoform X1 [Drosophila miranda]
MTCGACRGRKDKGIKCLIAALDTIKEHALMMQHEAEEKDKTIGSLQAQNEKLHRAVDLLKERQESLAVLHDDKRRKVSPKKSKEDISPLPQSQSSLNMNIALNSIELSDEDTEEQEDESIAETEAPSIGSPRKLRPHHRKPDVRNLENVQPNNVTSVSQSWLRKTPKNIGMMTKLSLTHRGSNLQFKQTRLKFDGNKASGSEKDVIEESPNPSPGSKRAPASRSLLQRTDIGNALNEDNFILSRSNSVNIKNTDPSFHMDVENFIGIDSLPDVSLELPVMPPPATPPHLKIDNSSESVVILTPATQDIIFVNDSSEDIKKIGTMDVLAEIMKEDDDACSSALLQYEKIMIDQQKHVQPNPQKVQTALAPVGAIKDEPITQPNEDHGNESTRLSEDIEKYMMEEDDSKESEDEIPRPIMVKDEPELTLKERFNIECEECEKFINFMGSNLNDEKIQLYLSKCKHNNERTGSPPGFWNPHMVSFAEDDPRNEVLIDTRFRDQR